MISDRQTHTALPEWIPCNGAGHLSFKNGLNCELDAIDSGHRHFSSTAFGPQGFDSSKSHVIVGRPYSADLIAKLCEPRIGLLKCFRRRPVGDLHI